MKQLSLVLPEHRVIYYKECVPAWGYFLPKGPHIRLKDGDFLEFRMGYDVPWDNWKGQYASIRYGIVINVYGRPYYKLRECHCLPDRPLSEEQISEVLHIYSYEKTRMDDYVKRRICFLLSEIDNLLPPNTDCSKEHEVYK